MAIHGDATVGNVHIIYNWTYADATAREAASGMDAADVGKFARQLDDDTIWMLTDDDPVTWVLISGTTEDATAIHTDETGEIAALDEKVTLVDDDLFVIEDSEGSNAKKKVKVSSLPSGGGSGLYSDYVCIRDEKSQNTAGGTFTQGAWRTRDLNTEVEDTGNLASVASNQITLEAGTYYCRLQAPASRCNKHLTRLFNISDTTVELQGSNAMSPSASSGGDMSFSVVVGRFTIASQKVFEFQHYCESTYADNGLGFPFNLTTEIYAICEFWKEA